MAGKILVGTASWSDPEFVRDWYPPRLRPVERLPYYARHFETVEVNSSFYAIPEPRMAEQWVNLTPPSFTFDVKLHQLLSRHACQLKLLPPALQRTAQAMPRGRVLLTPELERAAAEAFLRGIAPLERAGKLGALLLQLSPGFSPREHRLEELAPLLEQVAPRPVAVELRHRGWVGAARREQTARFLRDCGATLVSVDAPASEHFSVMPSTDEITNPQLAYLRLHGRNAHAYLTGRTVAERFDYDYSEAELDEVKERVEQLAGESEVVHVVFNNNRSHYAPRAALRFRAKLGQPAPDAEAPPPGESPGLPGLA